MLYCPQHDNRLKTEPWRQILLDAANIIDRIGWMQGCDGNERVGVCAGYAIRIAVISFSDNTFRKAALWNSATRAFCEWAGELHIEHFNDKPRMTKERIISALRNCALEQSS